MIQSIVLFLAMLSISAISEAEVSPDKSYDVVSDELSMVLQSHFDSQKLFKYVNYESIDQAHADEYGSMRYLVMDFDPLVTNVNLQGSIHHLCSSVLQDKNLLRHLSDAGFDMVSVSFDRQSQYDCL